MVPLCVIAGGGMKGLAFVKDPDGYWIEILPQGSRIVTHGIPYTVLDIDNVVCTPQRCLFSCACYRSSPCIVQKYKVHSANIRKIM